MSKALVIDQFELGPKDNYMYSIANKETMELVVIDPAWDVDYIRERAETKGYTIKAILLTHGHSDHINGVNELSEMLDIPVYVSRTEAEFYKITGENVITVEADFCYELGDVKINFIPTPGHTQGSQCFYAHGHLIAGDTLFIDGCGRCDMLGGDPVKMFDSIHNRLMKLPDSTIIYPGHTYHEKNCDTLGNQKKTNPYMLANTLESFIDRRMPKLVK